MEPAIPSAVFRGPDGRRYEVAAGGILGRLAGAALRIDNPRVSEAHALVTLRGDALVLMALRGGLAVDGHLVSQVPLRPEMRVTLTDDLSFVVEQVHMPPRVLALRGADGQVVPLVGEVLSLMFSPDLDVRHRYEGQAAAHLWSTGTGWRFSTLSGQVRELRPGQRLDMGGRQVEVIEVNIADIALPSTRLRGRIGPALRLLPAYAGVRIDVDGRPPVLIKGIPGRILSELCDYQESVDWSLVAQQIWPEERDVARLRKNWDRNLSSLRAKLTEAGIRPDLVHLDGRGNVELYLLPGDTRETESPPPSPSR